MLSNFHVFVIFISIGTKECMEQFQVFEMIAEIDASNSVDDEPDEVNNNEELYSNEQEKKKKNFGNYRNHFTFRRAISTFRRKS